VSRRATPRSAGPARGRQGGFTLIELLVSMIILAIVGTMLVDTWISLQRAFEYTQADNLAASTGRDALDRASSELRAAQPSTLYGTTPTAAFCVTNSSYPCDNYDCTFYSPYNNPQTNLYSGVAGTGQSVLTEIYINQSVSGAQKTLMLWRDTNHDQVQDAGDQFIKLASNVVNTTLSTPRPMFQYVLDTSGQGVYTTVSSLSSTNVKAVVAVNMEVVIDANLKNRPTQIDFVSTVRPRNVSAN
jgi:prepilin-type N-terminal cleavage/methylation domain-containing protein